MHQTGICGFIAGIDGLPNFEIDEFSAFQESQVQTDSCIARISPAYRIRLHARHGTLPQSDPSLRSGFRRAAQTPRKRLNLLKKTPASTLGVFQKVSRQARLADSTRRGGCMGRLSARVRLALIFVVVSFSRSFDQLQQQQPDHKHHLPGARQYHSRSRQRGFSRRGQRHSDLHGQPQEQQGHGDYDSGLRSFPATPRS